MEALDDLLSDTDCEGVGVHFGRAAIGRVTLAPRLDTIDAGGSVHSGAPDFDDADAAEAAFGDEGSLHDDKFLARGLWDVSDLGLGVAADDFGDEGLVDASALDDGPGSERDDVDDDDVDDEGREFGRKDRAWARLGGWAGDWLRDRSRGEDEIGDDEEAAEGGEVDGSDVVARGGDGAAPSAAMRHARFGGLAAMDDEDDLGRFRDSGGAPAAFRGASLAPPPAASGRLADGHMHKDLRASPSLQTTNDGGATPNSGAGSDAGVGVSGGSSPRSAGAGAEGGGSGLRISRQGLSEDELFAYSALIRGSPAQSQSLDSNGRTSAFSSTYPSSVRRDRPVASNLAEALDEEEPISASGAYRVDSYASLARSPPTSKVVVGSKAPATQERKQPEPTAANDEGDTMAQASGGGAKAPRPFLKKGARMQRSGTSGAGRISTTASAKTSLRLQARSSSAPAGARMSMAMRKTPTSDDQINEESWQDELLAEPSSSSTCRFRQDRNDAASVKGGAAAARRDLPADSPELGYASKSRAVGECGATDAYEDSVGGGYGGSGGFRGGYGGSVGGYAARAKLAAKPPTEPPGSLRELREGRPTRAAGGADVGEDEWDDDAPWDCRGLGMDLDLDLEEDPPRPRDFGASSRHAAAAALGEPPTSQIVKSYFHDVGGAADPRRQTPPHAGRPPEPAGRHPHWEGGEAAAVMYGRAAPSAEHEAKRKAALASSPAQTSSASAAFSGAGGSAEDSDKRQAALEAQIKKYEREAQTLKSLQAQAEQSERDLAREREKLWREVEAERRALHAEFDAERVALKKERRRLSQGAERQRQQLAEDREAQEERRRLQERTEELEEEIREKDRRWQRTVDRLQRQIADLQRKNQELQDEVRRANQQAQQAQSTLQVPAVADGARSSTPSRGRRSGSVPRTAIGRTPLGAAASTSAALDAIAPLRSAPAASSAARGGSGDMLGRIAQRDVAAAGGVRGRDAVGQAWAHTPDARGADAASASHEVKDVRTTEGRVERSFADGRREVEFANGLKKVIWPDGRTTVFFQNGDYKEIHSDGIVVYHYSATGAVQTTLADGTEIYQFSDGQFERHCADGSKEIQFPNGTNKQILADGSEEIRFADGTMRRTPALR